MSNVMPIDADSNEPTRVRRGMEDGKRVRVAVRSGAVIGTRATGRGTPKAGKSGKSAGGDAEKSEG